MYYVYCALDARDALRHANDSRVGYQTLVPAVGMLVVGAAVIVAGGLIGAMLSSPVAPSIEKLAAIRMAGIGVFALGIGLLPVPDASLRRGLFAYSAPATLYFCSLMLAATLVRESWPADWIITAAALHGVALAALVVDWLRRHSAEGSKLMRRV